MTSIITNTAASVALQTLRSLGAGLHQTETRVSSGLRVERAADNAAYWSIATTMRSDAKAVSAVSDALGLGSATVDTAYMAMSQAIDVMAEIKAKFVAAMESGVDKTKINEELDQLKSQLRSIAQSASFAGENWLYMNSTTDNVDRQVPASFVRDSMGGVSVQSMTYNLYSDWDTTNVSFLIDDESGDAGIITNSAFADSLGTNGDWVLFNGERHQSHREMILSAATTNDELQEMLLVTESMIAKMVEVGSRLGSMSKRISIQTDFASKLQDSIVSGVGMLVDANMEVESSRLSALQAQQQLALQSLSIANAAPQSVLSLFR